MSGTHFYLTLPSNASLNEFPNNKTTSYRVKLPQSIDLEGVWEVGLYSISYPNTWYTLQKGCGYAPLLWGSNRFVSASHYGLRLLPVHAGACQSCE